MKRLLLCFVLLGCDHTTAVLSEDGTKVLRTCRDEDHWDNIPPAVDCLSEACPNGLIILPRDKDASSRTVRCLKESK